MCLATLMTHVWSAKQYLKTKTILQGVNKVSYPHLTFEQIDISNWASGHVSMTQVRVSWCIGQFCIFPKDQDPGGIYQIKKS